MASTVDENHDSGVVFSVEDDGTISARDLETGIVRGGESKAEALTQRAEALTLHEGGGEPIEDPDAFLRDELGIEPSSTDEELPEFMQ